MAYSETKQKVSARQSPFFNMWVRELRCANLFSVEHRTATFNATQPERVETFSNTRLNLLNPSNAGLRHSTKLNPRCLSPPSPDSIGSNSPNVARQHSARLNLSYYPTLDPTRSNQLDPKGWVLMPPVRRSTPDNFPSKLKGLMHRPTYYGPNLASEVTNATMPNRNFDEDHGLRPSTICYPTGRIPYRSKAMLRSKCGLAQSNASFDLPVSNSTCSKWTQIESQTSVQQGHGQRYAQIWHRRHCCDYAYFQEPMRIIAIPIPFCYSIWLCMYFAFAFVFVFQGQMMPAAFAYSGKSYLNNGVEHFI